MGRNTRDKENKNSKETLLSQYSWSQVKERSSSCSMVEGRTSKHRLLPFSELCHNLNQKTKGSYCTLCSRIQKHSLRKIN